MSDIMKLGLILSATDKMTRVINTAADNVNSKFKNIERSMKMVNKVSNAMFVAGGVAAAGIFKAVQAAEDGAQSERKLANVFKQMWGDNGAANAAGKAASDYAEKLSLQIGVEDEIIRTTQAKLATFANVSNKTAMMSGIFDRATRAAHDMAAVGFGEAAQNAVMLGKALQEPMKMATALKKQGTLTAADIVNVKKIYETQGLLKAQEYILKAVERQVKGTGIATATATNIMKTGFSEVVEAIGGAFLPSVEDAKDGALGFIQPTLDWINSNHKLIQTIAKVAVWMLGLAAVLRISTFFISSVKTVMTAYTAVTKAWAASTKIATINQWLLNSAIGIGLLPVIAIIAGIGILVGGIMLLWKHSAKFRAILLTVWETVKGFGNILKEYVIDRITGILSGLGSVGKAIGLLFKGKFSAAFDEAKKGVKALSGYDAKMKAVTRTKALATSISGKYITTLATENAKQAQSEAKSTQAISTVQANNATNSSNSSVQYAPVINIASGSAADKESFRKQLDDNLAAFEQMMNRVNNKNKRLSYQ